MPSFTKQEHLMSHHCLYSIANSCLCRVIALCLQYRRAYGSGGEACHILEHWKCCPVGWIPRDDLRRALQGNVFTLGLVSFFTDVATEMIYPLLPFFLTGLVEQSVAALYIGLMDGIAESTSSLLKIYAGKISDSLGARKPLALAGYAISSFARPFTAFALVGWHVVALRFLDRIGKGIRTSPRDALISECSECDVRGLAFSFHRLMDHAGAVCGPLISMIFLYLLLGNGLLWHQESVAATPQEMNAMRWLFGLAVVPGLIATLLIWHSVHEVPATQKVASRAAEAVIQPATSRRLLWFVGAVTVFTLGNSSDLFLIFYIQTRFQLALGWIIALWMLLHISKIIFSLPGGRFSDRVGRRPAIMIGWLIYIAIYLAMPFASMLWVACALIAIYGAYYGMTEGAEKALIADLVQPSQRGRAYGIYHGAVGLAALPASLLFGVFWATLGPKLAFIIGASLAAVALLALAYSFTFGKAITTDDIAEPAAK